ncbi:hypothetical protein ABE485_29055 [Achromobacter spanius]|uniref:hypothetical protein n=1 Tax=Achromobacter spanius TaxID=217203 RepID=UPI003208D878
MDDYLWSRFELSNPEEAKAVSQAMVRGEVPLVIFWKNDSEWTLLTDQYLRGEIHGISSSAFLDEVSDVSTVNEKNVPPNEYKREAEYVSVGKGKKFWTPVGAPHFSLRNVLGMFPLNVP